MKAIKYSLFLSILVPAVVCCQKLKDFPDDEFIDKSNYEYLPDWQKGYLDIHQISTGRGNSAFCILPDGTTLLIDAGDMGDVTNVTQEIMPAVPSPAKRPAEWIVQYVRRFSAPLDRNGALDYVLLTHFDSDHIGKDDRMAISQPDKSYKLTGITHVAQLLSIGTLIDRAYPDYDYPTAEKLLANNAATFPNYRKYIAERDEANLHTEGFVVGSNEQIRLLHAPQSYPTFEIRNIAGNGKLWTGSGTTTKEVVPAGVAENQMLNENRCSCCVRITYGKFDYFSGGDILGMQSSPAWFDLETPVGEVVGEVDVALCNHHGFSDAMNESFIRATRPQAFVIPVWDYYHPQPETLARMLDTRLYTDQRLIFSAGLVHSNRIRLGDNGKRIQPAGHVVTRVYEGGEEFQIFVLNDRDEDYEIIYKSARMTSRE